MANKMKNQAQNKSQNQAGMKNQAEYAKELTPQSDQEVASEFPSNASQKTMNKKQQQQTKQ